MRVLQLLPASRPSHLYLEGTAQLFEQPEFRASIQLAIAERYRDLDDLEAALAYASEADKSLAAADDPALKDELATFMRDLKDA